MTYGNYPDLKKIKKILVIKLRHHGDVLLTSPVFSSLRQALPNAQIDAYIYKDTLPMLEGHPAISNFLFYDRTEKKRSFFKRIANEIRFFMSLKKKGYDLVVNLTEGDRGAMAALLSKSTYRVGFDRGGKRVFGRKKVYTHTIKHCPNPRHTVEKNLDALRCIGIFPSLEQRDLFLHIPKDSFDKARLLTKAHAKYVVIHPVSRWRFKCLPKETIAKIAISLLERGHKVVFTAGHDPLEIAMVEDIVALCQHPNVINLAGKTELKDLCAIIAEAQRLVCVDSVPLHIASATKTPVIAIFGPTSERNWGPWMNPRAIVLAQDLPCRPCFRDGCAGSKMSDCLFTLTSQRIISSLDSLDQIKQLAIVK